jgi:hypothetical protein
VRPAINSGDSDMVGMNLFFLSYTNFLWSRPLIFLKVLVIL